jgi:hypothetical protein
MNDDPFFKPAWMNIAFLFKVDSKTWESFHDNWENKNAEKIDLSAL